MQVTIYKATYNKAHNIGYSDELKCKEKRNPLQGKPSPTNNPL